MAMMTPDGARIAISARAPGFAQAALKQSGRYSPERVHFGKPSTSLRPYQSVIADMATDVQTSTFLTCYVVCFCGQDRPCTNGELQGRALDGENGYRSQQPGDPTFEIAALLDDAMITQLNQVAREVAKMFSAWSAEH